MRIRSQHSIIKYESIHTVGEIQDGAAVRILNLVQHVAAAGAGLRYDPELRRHHFVAKIALLPAVDRSCWKVSAFHGCMCIVSWGTDTYSSCSTLQVSSVGWVSSSSQVTLAY